MSTFRALNDWIIVLGMPDTTIGKSKLIIAPPDRTFYPLPTRGKVLSVGPGRRIKRTDRRLPPMVAAGDLVIFNKVSGYQVERDRKTYIFLKDKDILARVGRNEDAVDSKEFSQAQQGHQGQREAGKDRQRRTAER